MEKVCCNYIYVLGVNKGKTCNNNCVKYKTEKKCGKHIIYHQPNIKQFEQPDDIKNDSEEILNEIKQHKINFSNYQKLFKNVHNIINKISYNEKKPLSEFEEFKKHLYILSEMWENMTFDSPDLIIIKEIHTEITTYLFENDNMLDEWIKYLESGIEYRLKSRILNHKIIIQEKNDTEFFNNNNTCKCGRDYTEKNICCQNCSQYYCSICYVGILKKNKGVIICPYCGTKFGKEIQDFDFVRESDAIKSEIDAGEYFKCICQKIGILQCGKCNNKKYCSIVCQRKDWSDHKKQCKTDYTTLKKKIMNEYKNDTFIFTLNDNLLNDNSLRVIINNKGTITVSNEDSWTLIKKNINIKKSLNGKVELCICGDIIRNKKISCHECSRSFCSNCYINSFKNNEGLVICPYCSFTIGKKMNKEMVLAGIVSIKSKLNL